MNDITKYIGNDRFAKHNGIKVVRVEPGYALAEMKINDNHLNGVDIVHGGAIFALADVAFAIASNSRGPVALGINVSISYFKSPKGKLLTAEANEISRNKKLGSYNVDIFDEDKELIARFLGTVYIKN